MMNEIFALYADTPKRKIDLHEAFNLLEAGQHPEVLRDFAISKGFSDREFDHAVRSLAQVKALGVKARNPEEFVRAFVAKRKIAMDFDGMLSVPAAGLATDYTVANLINDIISTNYTLDAGFKESALRIEVERWAKAERDRVLNDVWMVIDDPDAQRCEKEWLGFATAMLDGSDEDATIPYVTGAWKSLIWQTKRKMRGLPVHDHLMLVLYGGQGAGKSEAVKRFLAPLAGCVTATNFAEAMDARHIDLWASPVLFFDEMEKAGKSDMDAIKNAITADKRTARVFHSQRAATFRVMTTFIGTMNGRLGDKIRDATGLRRFAPVPIRSKSAEHPTGCDHDVINATDFIGLWRSVRADDPHPLPLSDPTLNAMQEREREITPLEYWVRHFDGWHLGSGRKVGAKVLLEDYHSATEDLFPNHAKLNLISFGRALAEFVGKSGSPFERKSDGRNGTVYHLAERQDVEGLRGLDTLQRLASMSAVRRAA